MAPTPNKKSNTPFIILGVVLLVLFGGGLCIFSLFFGCIGNMACSSCAAFAPLIDQANGGRQRPSSPNDDPWANSPFDQPQTPGVKPGSTPGSPGANPMVPLSPNPGLTSSCLMPSLGMCRECAPSMPCGPRFTRERCETPGGTFRSGQPCSREGAIGECHEQPKRDMDVYYGGPPRNHTITPVRSLCELQARGRFVAL